MKLLPNWREILFKAWSVRLLMLAMLLTAIEAVLPLITFIPIPPGYFAVLSGLVTGAAFGARLLAQKNLSAGE
ncbi:hypothetical protein [Ancylobacter rudongensis]|uniref:Uncharacterized protein n=1 Tax=Ancylobacter rudongensis TaxID=177413 RepID=A0A1G4UQ86_9HYPH|nr:hypothetical protein [Ancylobacter rudongensis]SCW95684.1 hypothetical protein SAMN05660859_0090 [Ancylobacter rudongensis]